MLIHTLRSEGAIEVKAFIVGVWTHNVCVPCATAPGHECQKQMRHRKRKMPIFTQPIWIGWVYRWKYNLAIFEEKDALQRLCCWLLLIQMQILKQGFSWTLKVPSRTALITFWEARLHVLCNSKFCSLERHIFKSVRYDKRPFFSPHLATWSANISSVQRLRDKKQSIQLFIHIPNLPLNSSGLTSFGRYVPIPVTGTKLTAAASP